MINITEKAAAKMVEHISKDSTAIGIRVGVKGGGCSGYQYVFELATEEYDNDKKIEHPDVIVYIDKKSYIFLIGTEIDYTEDLMGSGFKFNNPAATRKRGCGESFSA